MIFREYIPEDSEKLAELFYDTVHSVNASDYSEKQLNVWATGNVDFKKWNASFLEHFTIVAVENDIITGFGDIDKTGYLDRLYVHKDFQRKGIATKICDILEQSASGKIIVNASITAKPFFEHRGYKGVKEQLVERQGIFLKNFVMEKQK